MKNIIIKFLLICWLVTAVVGCRIAVIVVDGGEVQSISSGTCDADGVGAGGPICIHQVIDTTYSETFTAVPDPGMRFVRWNSGGDFLCQDYTTPTCFISNVLIAGNPEAEAIVASDYMFYLMPIFEIAPPLPDTETITVDGRKWAQPDLFLNLSWDDINAVCPAPAGVCGSTAVLAGYNMSGWTLAGVDDVNALFNSYGVNPPLVGPSFLYVAGSVWAPAFFADGWRGRDYFSEWVVTRGWTVTPSGGSGRLAAQMRDFFDVNHNDQVYTNYGHPTSFSSDTTGAWFYRAP